MIDNINILVQYTGSGVTNEAFVVSIPFFDASDLIVLEDGVRQVQDVDYSVSGGGGLTGTVTWIGTTTGAIAIIRSVPLTQLLQYFTEGRFPAESHEEGLDRTIMAIQQCLARELTDGLEFDAQSRQIRNVLDGTGGGDAVNLSQLQTQTFLQSGGVPTPIDPGDDGSHLEALGGTYVLTTHQEVPVPVAVDDFEKILTVTTVGGVYGWEVPRALNQGSLVINGAFDIAQRGTVFDATTTPLNNNDLYLFDRWVHLSEAADAVDVTQELVNIPDGATAAAQFDWNAAGTLGVGMLQILDNQTTRRILALGTDTVVSVTAKIHGDAINGPGSIGFSMIGWTGAVDVVTSNLISAWPPSMGTKPTLIANWNTGGAEADGYYAGGVGTVVQSITTNWAEKRWDNIAIDEAGINNLGLFFYTLAGTASSDYAITDVQLTIGPRARPFEHRPIAEELALCRRYYQSIKPGAVGDHICPGFIADLATTSHFGLQLLQQMRADPAFSVNDVTHFQSHAAAAVNVLSDLTLVQASKNSISMLGTHAAGTDGLGSYLEPSNVLADIRLDAEL